MYDQNSLPRNLLTEFCITPFLNRIPHIHKRQVGERALSPAPRIVDQDVALIIHRNGEISLRAVGECRFLKGQRAAWRERHPIWRNVEIRSRQRDPQRWDRLPPGIHKRRDSPVDAIRIRNRTDVPYAACHLQQTWQRPGNMIRSGKRVEDRRFKGREGSRHAVSEWERHSRCFSGMVAQIHREREQDIASPSRSLHQGAITPCSATLRRALFAEVKIQSHDLSTGAMQPGDHGGKHRTIPDPHTESSITLGITANEEKAPAVGCSPMPL